MRFPERMGGGFGLLILMLFMLGPAAVNAAGQVASRGPGLVPHATTTDPSGRSPQLAFVQKAFPEATVGLPFHSSIQAIGGWGLLSMTVSGDLPPGLAVETGSNTVALSGVPTEAGDYEIEISVRDVNGAALDDTFIVHVSPSSPRPKPESAYAIVTDTENFTFNDSDKVFFPAVITDHEAFNFTDTIGEKDAVQIAVNEHISATDTEDVLFPIVIAYVEHITVTDAPKEMDSLLIAVNENLTVHDTDSGLDAALISDTEQVHVTDTVTVHLLAAPVITWPTPAAITYPTPLSGTQLDAQSSVAGNFVYLPASGTVLSAGLHTLSTTFTPTDTTDYATTTATVQLTVKQATPSITWTNPASIPYGTALSATQLDATASVPGTFIYSPGPGTVLPAGLQTLSVTFKPTDSTDYATATATVQMTVIQPRRPAPTPPGGPITIQP